ncbi:protein jagged-2 isoform X1 [Tachysurus ichikawai]
MWSCTGAFLHSVCLILTFWFEVCWASGYVELRVIGVENRNGELASGGCCGGERGTGQEQGCGAVECNTYFRACLKEYQVEVMTSGPCTYGTASSAVVGGNTVRPDGFSNNRNKGNNVGTLIIPFQFAWPVRRLADDQRGRSEFYVRIYIRTPTWRDSRVFGCNSTFLQSVAHKFVSDRKVVE